MRGATYVLCHIGRHQGPVTAVADRFDSLLSFFAIQIQYSAVGMFDPGITISV